MEKSKFDRPKKFGDRKDGWRIRNLSSHQKMIPVLMPQRSASCVYFKETYDVTNLVKFVDELNKENKGQEKGIRKYSYFGAILAAIARLLALRPHLNRFVLNDKLYQRRDIRLAFVAKKEMSESAPESDIVASFDRTANLDDIMLKLQGEIGLAKKGEDDSSDFLDSLTKGPHFVLKLFKWVISFLLKFDFFPESLSAIDPMQASVFAANLGSLNLDTAPYHHLYDRGTLSMFLVIGKIKKTEDDRYEVSATLTLDERVSSGFYYIKSMEIFKELLDKPKQLLINLDEDNIPLDV